MKSLQNLSYKTLFTILFFSLAGIVFFLRVGKPAKKVSAAWWDEMWHYRKAISITNSSGSNQANIQVKILENYDLSSLVTEGKLQSDLNDIRFTDINGNLIDYWIEDSTNTSVDIWGLISLVPSSDTDIYMYYGNNSANSMSNNTWMIDIGGTISYLNGYRIHAFKGNGSYYNYFDRNVEILVVAGGGGGAYRHGAGGGAGGLIYNNSFSITDNVSVTVGSGGSGAIISGPTPQSGANTIFSSLIAIGGGYAGGYDSSSIGATGGSGGGSCAVVNSAGIFGQGNSGGNGYNGTSPYNWGGGGGAGQIGGNGTATAHGNGGDGLYFGDKFGDIYGENGWFAGGGGGGGHDPTATQGYGGNGGGGDGGIPSVNSPGQDGLPNTGGGGGGAATSSGGNSRGGNGGSGIVLIRYRTDTITSSDISIESFSTEEIGTGPIAYWKFDEGIGTTAYDSTGNSNGTLGSGTSAPTWTEESQCISGKCLEFDNGNKYVALQNYPILGISSWTISAWVKIPTNVIGRVGTFFGNFNNSPTINLEVHGDGQLRYFWNAEIDQFGTTDLRDNQWHYITFIRDKNNNKSYMYIDGKIEKIINSNGSDLNLTGNFWLGSDQRVGGLPWHGLIDEVKIYSYARTADQIKQDYNSRGSLSGSSVNLGVRSNTAPSLKSSLVAYYKFDEGVGTTTYDSSGNNLNGTLGAGDSAPTWTIDSKFGKALSFNGLTNYVNKIDGNNELDMGLNDWTISTWIKTTDNTSTVHGIVNKTNNSSNDGRWGIGIDDGKAWYMFDATAYGVSFGLTGKTIINDDKWHHIVASYNRNGYLKGYVDNKEDFSYDISSAESFNINTSYPLRIGSYTSSSGDIPILFFIGLIDEVKIYNRALTAEEVKQDYNQGSVVQFGSTNQTIGGTTTSLEYCIPGDTSACSAPIAEWNFEENTGTVAKDTSGNNNDGTFGTGNSAPTWSLGQNNKGSAVNFINDASYIDNTSIIYGDSYTAEAWIKPTDLSIVESYGRTIIASSPTYNYPIWLLLRGNQIRAYAFSDSPTSYFIDSNFNNIQTNNWYHISLTATKNGQANLYINGILDSTFTTGAQATAQKLTIADLRPGRNISFKGSIDQIKIYNYIRTPAQIAYDYNRGAPIGHWKLDECQGGTAFDSSGLGNTGTIIIGASGSQNSLGTCAIGTSAAWTNGASGKINSSLNFDSTDDYVQIPNIISGDDTHTISFWVKPIGGVCLDMSGDSGYSFIQIYGGNTLYVGYSPTTASYRAYSYSFSSNKWYHVTVAKTDIGNNANVYVNGILLNSYTGAVGNMNNGSIMYLGKFHTGSYKFSGQIDDVRIYNYALTSEQVKQVYNGGAVNFK